MDIQIASQRVRKIFKRELILLSSLLVLFGAVLFFLFGNSFIHAFLNDLNEERLNFTTLIVLMYLIEIVSAITVIVFLRYIYVFLKLRRKVADSNHTTEPIDLDGTRRLKRKITAIICFNLAVVTPLIVAGFHYLP